MTLKAGMGPRGYTESYWNKWTTSRTGTSVENSWRAICSAICRSIVNISPELAFIR